MTSKPNFNQRHQLQELNKALASGDPIQIADLSFKLARQGVLPIIELFSVTQRLNDAAQGEQAIALYRTWLENTESPIAYAVHFNLGVNLANAQDDAGAEQQYRRAIAQKPTFVEAHLNLGTLMERKSQYDEALSLWRRVLTFVDLKVPADTPYYLQALNNLGRLLEIRKFLPEAEKMLTQSLLHDPNQPNVITHLVHLRQKQCEWPVYQAIGKLSAQDLLASTSALAMLSASNDPQQQLAASQRFVNEKVLSGVAPLAAPNGYRHKKLRIGYLSQDFCSHAVSILTVELFELHDRTKVEVFAFSWSNDDGTPLRARVVNGMDHYIRIKDMTDEQAAQRIRSHEIDILVDLHGLTLGTRPNILSYRPAPIQITWLGFPGPTAMPSIDYVIADKFVLPEELQPFFTEKPLYMPDCFQINDRKRAIGARPSRESCGLQEDSFVFCSFNNNFKFTEDVFATWMRILRRAPDSVLWLVVDTDSGRENLSAFAEHHGVARSRLVFAGRVAPADYLARYQVADLFLDTTPFNAGTTASDALWAGLPLLTYTGKTFSSRMAGSLLLACDLPELITYSLQEFEDKAVSLAENPARIAEMKRQLDENRLTCKLFDSPQFVRDLEDVYQRIAKSPAPPDQRQSTQQSPSTSQAKEAPMILPEHTPIADPGRVMNFMVQTVWGLTDPAKFYAIMAEAQKLCVPGCYLGDNLFTWGKSNSPFEDQNFVRAWESNTQNDADRAIAWRRYILACSAYHCAQLPGDFVECGVFRGTGIKTVIDYFGKDEFTKTFWGYDTFDYNPVASHKFVGQEVGLYQEICQRFAGYDRVKLIQGLLPDSLIDNSPEEIAYLHIDLNKAEYEIAVLNELFDRVVPGGMVILDDYEWSGEYRFQKIAEDAWFDKRKYRIFPLPTGQGLVLKR